MIEPWKRLDVSLAETGERRKHHTEAVSSHEKVITELHHSLRNYNEFLGIDIPGQGGLFIRVYRFE